MRTWEDGYTYEMFEEQQLRAKRYDDEFVESERRYRVDWFNSKFEDTEFIEAYDEYEAEDKALELIPEDATITSIRVA